MKTIAAFIDLSSGGGGGSGSDSNSGGDKNKNVAIAAIVEKHQRYRRYVEEVLDLVFDLRWTTGKGGGGGGGVGRGVLRPVVLYSLKDDGFKILM